MKRLVVRLLGLSLLVVLGLFAIAQAQKRARDGEPANNANPSPDEMQPKSDTKAPVIENRRVGNSGVGNSSVGNSSVEIPPAGDLQTVRPVSTSARQRYADGTSDPFERFDNASNPYTGQADVVRANNQPVGGDQTATAAGDRRYAADPPSDVTIVTTDGTDQAPAREIPGRAASEIEPARIDTSGRTTTAAPATVPAGDDRSRYGGVPRRVAGPAAIEPNDPVSQPVDNSLYDQANNKPEAIASATTPAATTEGTGRPGNKTLEGLQSPSLSLEKSAPAEVQVGKPATFTIRLQNNGPVAALGVQIVDIVPKGTRLIATTPRATVGAGGKLIWTIGTLQAGAATTVKVELMPVAEGPIGSVASVVFRADASAQTIATKPRIALTVDAPKQVMIGQTVVLTMTITNPGTGTARGVIIETDVPKGMKHPAGEELEFEVGDLKPNEKRTLKLVLTAARAGLAEVAMQARGDSVSASQQPVSIEVLAPQLAVGLQGPKRRYLDRKATYKVSIDNRGTASAKEVELVAYLPKGMKFVEANNSGTYDANDHAVYWSLEELPAKTAGDVTLVAIPTEPGTQTLRVEGKADQGLSDKYEETIAVEGIESLTFQVVDRNDPVEIGGEALYDVRVVNAGTKSATGVKIVVQLPAEIKPVSAEGPTAYAIQGAQVVFEPLTRLAPKEEKTFKIRGEALRAGDLRIRVLLQSDIMSRPVVKEESTRVFGDQ